jgi:hypothetical protein
MAVLREAPAAGPARLAVPLLLAAGLFLPAPAPAARAAAPPVLPASSALGESAAPEYRVKAAFLFNFARFVEWPEAVFGPPGAPIVFGVLGEDPFGPALDETLEGKRINGRPLEARRFADLKHLQPCAVLFVSHLESKDLEETLEALREAPVLTVGEGHRFARLGGIVSFFLEDNRVRFQINAEAARRAGLRISSRLLELARAMPESEHADH